LALVIPTTEELKDRYLTNLESALNQNSPLADKAFLRVLAATQALDHTELYRVALERALQNLAITATGEDLDRIGEEYDVVRKPAEAAQITAELPAVTDTVIPATTDFTGDSNGVRYFPDNVVISIGGIATIPMTAETLGVGGNLNPGDTLTIGTQIPGAETTATVLTLDNTGAERETDDQYRVRVLDQIRSQGGGGNTADYRNWSQEVAGVVRTYPYSGRPITDPTPSEPPERTVYVEVSTDIDPDGLAPQSILDEVRDTINNDPETGISRPPLGTTDDTLFVESISRLTFFVNIIGLSVEPSLEGQVKNDIEEALALYFRILQPFVDGLDPLFDKNDIITDLS